MNSHEFADFYIRPVLVQNSWERRVYPDIRMATSVRQALDNKYICIRDFYKQDVTSAARPKVQMLYPPRIEEPIVLVSLLLLDVSTQVEL